MKTFNNEVHRALASTKLGMERIHAILDNTDKEYRVYTIPKANGGKRTICEPSADLKKLQRTLLWRFIKRHKVSKYATAYERGCSIKKNAKAHQKNKYILHVDIKDFFPSITKEMVDKTFPQKLSWWQQDNEAELWKTVSYKGGLPIGAPTSPFVANRVMYDADKKLAKLGGIFKKIKYTRYADDMIFSSKKPLDVGLVKKIEKIITDAGFTVNDKKTFFMHKRKEVTGIIITDDGRLSVGTSYKKRVKQDIYNLLKYGKGHRQKVMGRFAHLKNIEPAYASVIKSKYKDMDKIGFFGA